jgi:hypothetical protein
VSAAKGKLTSDRGSVYQTAEERAKILLENTTIALFEGLFFWRCYTWATLRLLQAEDAQDAQWLGNNYWIGDSRSIEHRVENLLWLLDAVR